MTHRWAGMARWGLATLGLTAASAALAGTQHSYDGISEAAFACIVATSEAEHGTRYDSASGQAITETVLYSVTMRYAYDPVAGRIDYELLSKSWIVPESAIWPGIEDTIARCR